MTHLWVRAEQRDNETRTGLTPAGAARLIASGITVTLEDSVTRCIPTARYAQAGARIVPPHSWPNAPAHAIIFGLKELPEDGTPLIHRHVMFGHAYRGQPAGRRLLQRFAVGGGLLEDLECLVDSENQRLAAFGYWAGYAGAAVGLKCWIAQQGGPPAGPLRPYPSANHLLAQLQSDLVATGTHRPSALIIGALGRSGRGAVDLCTVMGVPTTRWDMAETAHGGPFPELLAHDLFFNCILARPGTPIFVGTNAPHQHRRLRVIGDIACDPYSDFSPIKICDQTTDWSSPARRVHDTPPLDVIAIDNLPSLMPLDSSEDFAAQLLPCLQDLRDPHSEMWSRTRAAFQRALATL